MLTSRKTLGLAVTRQAITAVEVITSRGRHRLVHAAELPLTQETGLQDPVKLGGAIKELLRANRFSASRCVIGLEAAYLSAKDKRLPAAASGSIEDILRIAAERDFASDGQDLIIDYAPSPNAEGTGALLVAAPRRVVDQVLAAAGAAGLTVAAVTSSALALAQATVPSGPQSTCLVLSLSPGGAELVVQFNGSPHLVRRLSASMGVTSESDSDSAKRFLGELEAELHRMLAANMAETQPGQMELLVWNAAGLDGTAMRTIGEHLRMRTRICNFPADLDGLDGAPPHANEILSSAAALAIANVCGKPMPLDFLHSRLVPRKQRRIGRLAFWITAAAVVVIGAVISLLLDWRSDQREIADLKDRLGGLSASVQQARELTNMASFARGWYDRRPKFLNCLREVTLAFPEEGRIWTTSLVVREDMRMVLSGRSIGEETVLNLLDSLKSDPKLAEVKPLYIRKVGANSQEVSFAISFSYPGAG
jgi:hypothetical protein